MMTTIENLQPENRITLYSNEEKEAIRKDPELLRKLIYDTLKIPKHDTEREAYLKKNGMIVGLVGGRETAIQKVHTPFWLTEEMFEKVEEICGQIKNKKILVYNAEFLEILYKYGIMLNNEIWFVNENAQKVEFAKRV